LSVEKIEGDEVREGLETTLTMFFFQFCLDRTAISWRNTSTQMDLRVVSQLVLTLKNLSYWLQRKQKTTVFRMEASLRSLFFYKKSINLVEDFKGIS